MSTSAALINFPEKSPLAPETATEFLASHEDFLKSEGGPDDFINWQRTAAARVAQTGLPTPKLERWKYTNLIPAVRGLGGGGVPARASIALTDPGHFARELNAIPAAVASGDDRGLWHLADAYVRGGLVFDIPAGKAADKPAHLKITGQDGTFSAPHVTINIGAGAEFTLIEEIGGSGHFWSNAITRIVVEDNARFYHYRFQECGAGKAVTTHNTQVSIGRDATYEAFTLTTGAALSRNEIDVALTGVNGTCSLYGINMLRGKQLGDTTITITHQAPHCASNQFYRSVLDDQAHGVFQGKVHVDKIAQKTDGYQLSNALILSEGAEMDTKPELEIYADDVKCSHGATTGQLNEEALFYMRSRGLDRDAAYALLIEAFVQEAAARLSKRDWDEVIAGKVRAWLGR